MPVDETNNLRFRRKQSTYRTMRTAHDAHMRDQKKNLDQMKVQLQELLEELDGDAGRSTTACRRLTEDDVHVLHSTPEKKNKVEDESLNQRPQVSVLSSMMLQQLSILGRVLYINFLNLIEHFVIGTAHKIFTGFRIRQRRGRNNVPEHSRGTARKQHSSRGRQSEHTFIEFACQGTICVQKDCSAHRQARRDKRRESVWALVGDG